MKLRGRVDCGKVLPGNIESKATIGDLAVARMRTKGWDERFVVGVVVAAGDDGHVRTIAIARNRPSWAYSSRVYVGAREKLNGMTAEQIALKLTRGFKEFEEARKAILEVVTDHNKRENDDEGPIPTTERTQRRVDRS